MLTSSGACWGRGGCWRRRRGYAAGQIARPAYKSIKDRAVDEAVTQQEQAGLTVLTDGEMRRLSFQSQMVQAVEGFGEWDLGAFLWGDWHGHEEVGDSRRERPKDLGVVAPLRRHPVVIGRRIRPSACPHGTHPQGDAAQSRAVCEFWSP